jgi:prophage regulatory protein
MGHRLLRLGEVQARIGLSRSTIYSQIKLGKFPKPVKLGPSASAWVEAEVESWLAARISERNAEQGSPPHNPDPSTTHSAAAS